MAIDDRLQGDRRGNEDEGAVTRDAIGVRRVECDEDKGACRHCAASEEVPARNEQAEVLQQSELQDRNEGADRDAPPDRSRRQSDRAGHVREGDEGQQGADVRVPRVVHLVLGHACSRGGDEHVLEGQADGASDRQHRSVGAATERQAGRRQRRHGCGDEAEFWSKTKDRPGRDREPTGNEPR